MTRASSHRHVPGRTRRGGLWIIALAAALLAVSACGGIKNSYQNYHRTRAGDYPEAVKRWSAYGSVYRGFQTILLAHGTYKSAAFRRAYAEKYAADHRLNQTDRRRLLDEEAAAAAKGFEFVLALYAPDKETINLGSPRSLWTIYLENDAGQRLSPDDIRGLDRDRARLMEYYPYITPWQELYRVRFPADPALARSRLHLVLTGVQGTTRLTFPLP